MTAAEKQEVFIRRKMEFEPAFWDQYCELVSHELLSPEELQELTFRKRKELLKFAYERTKFYRDLYDANSVTPDDVKTEEDWVKLPIVTKQMLKEHLQEMCIDSGKSAEFKQYAVRASSGGSTGKPVKFFTDRRENGSSLNFNELRAYGWWLDRPKGDPVWKNGDSFLGQNEAWIERVGVVYPLLKSKAVRAAIADKLLPQERFYLDVMEMDENEIRNFTELANEKGVFYLTGYAGALEEVAGYYHSGKIRRSFTPRIITSRATPLSAVGRRVIEDGFACPVYDVYGSNETYFIAFECPKSASHALHVASDLRYVDLVDERGVNVPEGEEGTLVVTDFMNHVMPLIRYSLGDRTSFVKGHCSCGLPFPLIKPVQGRESDYVIAFDGSHIIGLCCAFDEYPDCADRYQFVQHAPGKVTLRVVPNKSYADYDADCKHALKDLINAAKGRVDYDLQYVDEIPHDGGKIRFIVYE